MPAWLYRPLANNLGALQAEELEVALAAACAPWSESTLKGLIRETRRARFGASRQEEQAPVEHDPDKAAEWFRSIGAQVTDGDSGNRDPAE